jgi:hypothetical protein
MLKIINACIVSVKERGENPHCLNVHILRVYFLCDIVPFL